MTQRDAPPTTLAAAPPGLADFRYAKNAAREHLPPGHPVREAMLSEPDFMPQAEKDVKVHTYARMLLALPRP